MLPHAALAATSHTDALAPHGSGSHVAHRRLGPACYSPATALTAVYSTCIYYSVRILKIAVSSHHHGLKQKHKHPALTAALTIHNVPLKPVSGSWIKHYLQSSILINSRAWQQRSGQMTEPIVGLLFAEQAIGLLRTEAVKGDEYLALGKMTKRGHLKFTSDIACLQKSLVPVMGRKTQQQGLLDQPDDVWKENSNTRPLYIQQNGRRERHGSRFLRVCISSSSSVFDLGHCEQIGPAASYPASDKTFQ
ncbi:hypothetical protein CB1_002313006 [Camelus ferus]|nr:hypothetical protein CB1_002313006 [Camelus ferus]